jgi:hypothetical protein
MKKRILISMLFALGLMTAVNAAETSVTSSSSHRFAIGAAEDYGFGVTMQFDKMIDFSVGHAGTGADFIFYRYPFMPKSKFFSKKPLNFYVGGGLGYVWDDNFAGMKKGAVVRAPLGADWTFHPHWSVYASASPALNFKEDSGTSFIVIGTIGIRYLF